MSTTSSGSGPPRPASMELSAQTKRNIHALHPRALESYKKAAQDCMILVKAELNKLDAGDITEETGVAIVSAMAIQKAKKNAANADGLRSSLYNVMKPVLPSQASVLTNACNELAMVAHFGKAPFIEALAKRNIKPLECPTLARDILAGKPFGLPTSTPKGASSAGEIAGFSGASSSSGGHPGAVEFAAGAPPSASKDALTSPRGPQGTAGAGTSSTPGTGSGAGQLPNIELPAKSTTGKKGKDAEQSPLSLQTIGLSNGGTTGAGMPESSPTRAGGRGGVSAGAADGGANDAASVGRESARESVGAGGGRASLAGGPAGSAFRDSVLGTGTGSVSTPMAQANNPIAVAAYQQYCKEQMLDVLGRLLKHRTADVFDKPVTDDEAPGYSAIVKEPMDLTTLRTLVEGGSVTTLDRFKELLTLIWDNCILYNSTNKEYQGYARSIQKDAAALLAKAEQNIEKQQKRGPRHGQKIAIVAAVAATHGTETAQALLNPSAAGAAGVNADDASRADPEEDTVARDKDVAGDDDMGMDDDGGEGAGGKAGKGGASASKGKASAVKASTSKSASKRGKGGDGDDDVDASDGDALSAAPESTGHAQDDEEDKAGDRRQSSRQRKANSQLAGGHSPERSSNAASTAKKAAKTPAGDLGAGPGVASVDAAVEGEGSKDKPAPLTGASTGTRKKAATGTGSTTTSPAVSAPTASTAATAAASTMTTSAAPGSAAAPQVGTRATAGKRKRAGSAEDGSQAGDGEDDVSATPSGTAAKRERTSSTRGDEGGGEAEQDGGPGKAKAVGTATKAKGPQASTAATPAPSAPSTAAGGMSTRGKNTVSATPGAPDSGGRAAGPAAMLPPPAPTTTPAAPTTGGAKKK